MVLAELASWAVLARRDRWALRIYERSDNGTVHDIGIRRGFCQTWKTAEFQVEVATNSQGFRERDDPLRTPIDVGCYGDSFAFGHGVSWGERYTDRLRERYPGKNVYGFAYLNGYAPPHYELFHRRRPEYAPRLGIVQLFLGNDLTSDIAESVFEQDNQGELTAVSSRLRCVDRRGFLVLADENTRSRVLRTFNLGELLVRSRPAAALGIQPQWAQGTNEPPPESLDRGELDQRCLTSLDYLARMHAAFRSDGRRLVALIVPYAFYVGEYDAYCGAERAAEIRREQRLPKAVEAWCRQRGIEVVNPIDKFQQLESQGQRLYYEKDGHWNPAGHAAAAQVLADYLGPDPTAAQAVLERPAGD